MSELGTTEDGLKQTALNQTALKQTVKDALVEVLEERRDILRDVIEEVLEEFEMIEDYREVRKADGLRRRPVFAMSEGEA